MWKFIYFQFRYLQNSSIIIINEIKLISNEINFTAAYGKLQQQ